jgi:glycosyltransferase involved in cell wall biosynthesis
MSTDFITIITTYYNETNMLIPFLEDYKKLRNEVDHYKLIIVDDGSTIDPITNYLDVVKMYPDVEVYRIPKDLGFNSHGARNLGVTVAKSKFVFLTDIDCILTACKLQAIDFNDLDDNTFYNFTVNCFMLTKEMFLSCKGYDEEFAGIHYGDRLLIKYFRDNYNFVPLQRRYKPRRGARQILFGCDVDRTTYDDEDMKIYHPSLPIKWSNLVGKICQRYIDKQFNDKKILNFEWERLI